MTSNTEDNPIIILAIYLLFGTFFNGIDYYNEEKYFKSFICFLLGTLIWVLIIYFLWYLWTESRSCPSGYELFILQRDINDIITPEYTIYKNKAPAFNNEDPDFPPAVRVDTPTLGLSNIFFPTFSFVKPTYSKVFDGYNFKALQFDRIDSFSSIFFPSYSVFQKENPEDEIAQILYPILSEEADFWSLTGLQLRYVIKYQGKRYVSNRQFEILEMLKGNFVKTFKFYDYDTGSEDDPIAIIKVRENAFNVDGRYTLCIKDVNDTILKELIFATIIAFDQHIMSEDRQKRNKN